jgi:hypothetical protein
MKFNKWTLGLAAVGAVSLAAVAQAEEKANMVMTATSSTTLSGYIDTSINWNLGSGNAQVPGYAFNTPAKQDGFNLDAVLIRIAKPLDESEYAAGYDVDLFLGPDGSSLGTSAIGGGIGSDFAIKQAYVNLRTPIFGTGIDWKLGVFDNWIGYESTESPSNPNFTRSYGYTLEPTTFTGLMGTYKVNDMISISGGIANTTGPVIGGEQASLAGASFGRAQPYKAESYKTYLGSVALTAPKDMGFLEGSTLYAGFVNGWSGGATTSGVQTSLYTGATLNTPVAGLKAGISYDYFNRPAPGPVTSPGGGAFPPGAAGESWANAVAVYTDYQFPDSKFSVHGRAEYFWESRNTGVVAGPDKVFALTGTVQYDLWKNVLSRLELRWDHQAGDIVGGGPFASGGYYDVSQSTTGGVNAGVGTLGGQGKHDAFLVVANIVYKF